MYVVDYDLLIWNNDNNFWEVEGHEWAPTDTFENILYDRVIDSLNTLLSDEFNIPVRYDDYILPQCFLILPEGDEFIAHAKSLQSRDYEVSINYQLKTGGRYGKKSFRDIAQKAEHVKRLIQNNTSYSSSGSYKWHDGRVSGIEYERDEDDPTLIRALITFNCTVTEVT
tara:strand:+ start:216 stop:722 length:507 start_codon:yes stop_codon:yes gene_type:complete